MIKVSLVAWAVVDLLGMFFLVGGRSRFLKSWTNLDKGVDNAESERTYKCGVCGLTIDRDLNAAINLSKLPVGNGEVKPVEMEALAGRSLISETTVYEAGTGLGH